MVANEAAIQGTSHPVEGGNTLLVGELNICTRNHICMSREELLTFDMLECHPLVTDQVEYEFRWDKVDALYEFIDRLPTWIVDDDIMEVWRTGDEECSSGASKAGR